MRRINTVTEPAVQGVQGGEVCQSNVPDGGVGPGNSEPLARQSASLGSFDFMKLFEAGANGALHHSRNPEPSLCTVRYIDGSERFQQQFRAVHLLLTRLL